jgi:hypothetical protein
MVLQSHAGDYAVEVTWLQRDVDVELCWRQCCRVLLATTLPCNLTVVRYRCRVLLVTMLSSHARKGAAEVTWLWRDIDAESC